MRRHAGAEALPLLLTYVLLRFLLLADVSGVYVALFVLAPLALLLIVIGLRSSRPA